MKQKDLALIVVIAIVSGVISFIVSTKLFVTPSNRQQKVELVDEIKASFDPPSQKYFNKDSINPTQQTQIGQDSNANPFNGAN